MFITNRYLRALLGNNLEGVDRLAFVLAHELRHTCRRHCRRHYRQLQLREELDSLERNSSQRRGVNDGAGQSTASSHGKIGLSFRFIEERLADLFALYLCRNAGYNENNALDFLREWALRENAEQEGAVDTAAADSNSETEEPPAERDALNRLGLLCDEREGIFEDERFGLFEYDATADAWTKLSGPGLAKGERAVLCIHGMNSDLSVYQPFMRYLASAEDRPPARLLGFQFPGDASLARAGRCLTLEIDRTCDSTVNVDFVCHSAGGLVFRYFAEIEQEEFRRAVFHATPHYGSDLAQIRPLLEVKDFFGSLNLGYPVSLQQAISDARGPMRFDLQPDSLFLQYLNRNDRSRPVDRYAVFRGRAMKPSVGALAEVGLMIGRRQMKQAAAKIRQSPLLRESLTNRIEQMRLPEEVTAGDLAVTLDSATLDGVNLVETYPLNHMELPKNASVIAATANVLFRADRTVERRP